MVRPIRYIDRWQLNGSPQPLVARRVRMDGFVFLVDSKQITPMVDRHLNVGESDGLKYEPPSMGGRSIVVFAFSDIDYVAAKNPPYADTSCARERELAVFVPAWRRGQPLPEFFTPYIFVDNPSALAPGREIYGFPKELGEVEFGRRSFAVRVHGVEKFKPGAELHWCDLLRFDLVEPGGPVSGPWSTFDEAAMDMNMALTQFDPRAMARSPFGDQRRWPPRGPAVFLKQFQAAEDGSLPCYQAIVGAELSVPRFRTGFRTNERWQLQIQALDSHPLREHLGVGDVNGMATPLFSYWMEFDFEMSAGTELWRAEITRRSPPASLRKPRLRPEPVPPAPAPARKQSRTRPKSRKRG